jgi:EmrB/QacA subfamily drug resistance transporter
MSQRLTLLAMCVAQGMILLDVTIVNIALPAMQRELHLLPGSLTWVISAYALSLAALIPLSGALGDRYGRKRLFLAGMAVFTLGSVACALSPSATALVAARAVQGAGGAVMSALTLSILAETYPPARRPGAIGIWAAVSGLGFGLGPVVGGLLLGPFGWPSIFWVNVPLAAVGLALTAAAVRESRGTTRRPLDLPGAAASALGLLGVTFGLIESSSRPWASWPVAAPLVAGAAVLAAFACWERRTPWPMAPPALLRARGFAAGCGVYLLSYAALTGVMFYLTLLDQNVDRWSALRTGLSWLIMTVPFLLMAQGAGWLTRRLPAPVLAGGGALAAAAGTGGMAGAGPSAPAALTVAGYVLLGAGFGALIPVITSAAMRDVPAGFSGAASGVLNAARQAGTSAGAQIGAVTRALGSAYRAPAVQAFTDGYRAAIMAAGLCLLAAGALAVTGLRPGHRTVRRRKGQIAVKYVNEIAPAGHAVNFGPTAPTTAVRRSAEGSPDGAVH